MSDEKLEIAVKNNDLGVDDQQNGCDSEMQLAGQGSLPSCQKDTAGIQLGNDAGGKGQDGGSPACNGQSESRIDACSGSNVVEESNGANGGALGESALEVDQDLQSGTKIMLLGKRAFGSIVGADDQNDKEEHKDAEQAETERNKTEEARIGGSLIVESGDAPEFDLDLDLAADQ